MKDAYILLNEAIELWKQNAMSQNDATIIKKDNFNIPLSVNTPHGIWQLTNVVYDEHFGVMFEAKVKPHDGS